MTTDVSPSSLPLPPGDLGWPIIGETLRMYGNEEQFFEERHKQHGDVFLTHIMWNPTVVVRGEDNLRELFAEENKSMSLRWPPAVEILVGKDNLLIQSGKVHKRSRNMLMPAFSKKAIDKLMPRIHAYITERIESWAAASADGGAGVNISTETADLTYCLNVALLLGGDPSTKRMRRCVELIRTLEAAVLTLPLNIPFTPMWYGMQARDELSELVQNMIDERRERLQSKRPADNDSDTDGGESDSDGYVNVLDLMLTTRDRDGAKMSDEEIKSQLIVLFSAGSLTTGSSIYCFLSNIGQRPSILQRMHDEQLETFGENIDRMPTAEEIASWDYMHNVLHEALRVQSPVACQFRHASKAMKCGKYQIPEGYTIILTPISNHRKEEYFEDADEFNPDRWETFRHDRANMFKYQPFWQGVRQCIGKHFAQAVRQLFASEIAKKYTVELSGDVGKFQFQGIVPIAGGKTMMRLTRR